VGKIDNIVLEPGDILYDTVTGDIAVLLRRTISTSHKWSFHPQIPDDGTFKMYAWKMYWVPPDWCTYTESSLYTMIESGRLILYKGRSPK